MKRPVAVGARGTIPAPCRRLSMPRLNASSVKLRGSITRRTTMPRRKLASARGALNLAAEFENQPFNGTTVLSTAMPYFGAPARMASIMYPGAKCP
jgi:hypothetical protein